MSEGLQTPEPAPVAAPTPMDLLKVAMSQGVDLDRMERLMAMQERYEANEARKAFNSAFAAFKAEAVQIVKNVTVTDGPLKGKKYADLFAVVDAATPALSKHGLSAAWRLTKDEKEWLEVACFLKHVGGHFETVTMGGPPDAGGAKNAIQARGSSVAYLERYTFLAVTGLAAKNQDNDGRAMSPELLKELDAIQEAKTLKDLQEIANAAFKRAGAARKPAEQSEIIRAKDARKAELQGGAK